VSSASANRATQTAASSISPCPCSDLPLAVAESTRMTATASGSEPARASTLVPLRETLSAHGFVLAWNSMTDQATAVKGTTRVTVTADSGVVCLNGATVSLPTVPRLRKGRLLVPQTLIALALNEVRGTHAAQGLSGP